MARILIVDDEPLITAMLEDWLSELGDIVVGPAHSLARALQLADSDIDAAIVDVSLGKDNSYPVLEALIARGVPFALATGHGQENIEPRYREQATLMKPFEFTTFRQALDRLRAAERGMGTDALNSASPGAISATR
jgi:DNA-binding response OmpR family regulator